VEAKRLCELTATYIWRDSQELNPVFAVLFGDGEPMLHRVSDLAADDPRDKKKFPLRDDFVSDVIQALSVIRRSFQACYLRVDGSNHNFEALMREVQSTIRKSPDISDDHIFFDRPSFCRGDRRAKQFQYALLGNHVRQAIISVALSAQRKGRVDEHGRLINIMLAEDSSHDNEAQDYVIVEFSNLPNGDAERDAFVAMRPLLSDYYQVTEISQGSVRAPAQRRILETGEYIVSLCVKLYQGGD